MIACAPLLSVEMVRVAIPPASVAVPMAAPASLKVTVPTGVPTDPVTVAVNVTACPKLLGLTDDASEALVAAV